MKNLLVSVLFCVALAGCTREPETTSQTSSAPPLAGKESLVLMVGSEMVPLDESVVMPFEAEHNVDIILKPHASMEIAAQLKGGQADAALVSHPLWLAGAKTSEIRTVMRTPLVFALKPEVAQRRGWLTADGAPRDISPLDIRKAAEEGNLRYMIASPAQSGGGYLSLLSNLYAFANVPLGNALTLSDLRKPAVQKRTREFLQSASHRASSSSELSKKMRENYGAYDGLWTYEVQALELNKQLAAAGKKPLVFFYLKNATPVAEATLAYCEQKGREDAHRIYGLFRDYLSSEKAQRAIMEKGWRITERMRERIPNDPNVFRAGWGIKADEELFAMNVPSSRDVTDRVQNLYAACVRQPWNAVILIDTSAKMSRVADGEVLMETARIAALNFVDNLRSGGKLIATDETHFIAFSDTVHPLASLNGIDDASALALSDAIRQLKPSGGCDISAALIRACKIIASKPGSNPVIYLMTQGKATDGNLSNAARLFATKGLQGSAHLNVVGLEKEPELSQTLEHAILYINNVEEMGFYEREKLGKE